MSQKPQGRVRFVECRLEIQAAETSARVVLAARDGAAFTGLSRGKRKDADLWQAADATVVALRQVFALEPDALADRPRAAALAVLAASNRFFGEGAE